jgi:serine/threonine protein kinase
MAPTLSSADVLPPRRGPATGRTLAGKYLLGDLLGKGGRGEVYAAIQLDLDREVAVKLLSAEGAEGDARDRFLRETRIAAEIRHPGVVQIFDAGIAEDGAPFCAMELLLGDTLAERLEHGGPLPAGEAVAMAAHVCLALQAVHDKGFLHRDVKPGNIMLARRADGGMDPKLIDFGIAKRVAVTDETRRRLTTRRGLGAPRPPIAPTALNVIVGTPRYLSPEQILGTSLDARSDVYALAATLYEAISGLPPFAAEDVGDLLAKILGEAPEPPSRRASSADREVPAPLDAVILGALAKDPAARPASAADFASRLWGALAEARLSDVAAGVPGGVPLDTSPARRKLGLAIVVGVAVTAAALLAVGLTRQPAPGEGRAAPARAYGASALVAAAPTTGAGEAPRAPSASTPALEAAPRPSPSADHPGRRANAPRRSDDLKTPY